MQVVLKLNPRALRVARMRSGLSQRELAAKCAEHGQKVSHANIAHYEQGRVAMPYARTMRALAAALDVEVDDLLSEAAGDAA